MNTQRELELEAEVMRLREIIEKLWVVIDDIDTYSDMAKSDDKLYRSLVERRQKDRWGTGINCDGYKLEFPTPFAPTALQADSATAWAQAHRLALELECLLLDTKDNAIVSKWWDSGMEALSEYQELQPGAAESAEAWAKMRKSGL